jgi:hypothetical protein
MPNLNRRALVAGAATLPAIAIPALATQADPIFAAIEKHKVIHAEYERAAAEFDRVSDAQRLSDELRRLKASPISPWEYPSHIKAEVDRLHWEPEYVRTAIINDEALDRYCRATQELANTQPTTLEGIGAALTYRADNHGTMNADRYETLVRAACAIAGLPEPAAVCFEL